MSSALAVSKNRSNKSPGISAEFTNLCVRSGVFRRCPLGKDPFLTNRGVMRISWGKRRGIRSSFVTLWLPRWPVPRLWAGGLRWIDFKNFSSHIVQIKNVGALIIPWSTEKRSVGLVAWPFWVSKLNYEARRVHLLRILLGFQHMKRCPKQFDEHISKSQRGTWELSLLRWSQDEYLVNC